VKKTFIIPVVTAAIVGAGLLSIQQASAAGKNEVLYINNKLVDCVGVGPQKCMQVRKSPKSEWTLFYGGIDGFRYEPGYRYKLKVNVSKIKNPPMDSSSLKYSLVKVLSKKK